eukprot:669799-Lingulodinium_polyedra.AAC.1
MVDIRLTRVGLVYVVFVVLCIRMRMLQTLALHSTNGARADADQTCIPCIPLVHQHAGKTRAGALGLAINSRAR